MKASEDVVLDLSETTHNISTEATIVASVSKELVTTEQEVTKQVTVAQGNNIEPAVPAESAIAAAVQYVTTEPDTAEDAPMELTEVARNAAAESVNELAAQFVTTEPETVAENAPMDLTEVEIGRAQV